MRSLRLTVLGCLLAAVPLVGPAAGAEDAPPVPAPAGGYPLHEEFNGTAAGTLPPDWSADTSGGTGTVAVDALPDTVDRSLRMTKAQAPGNAIATTRFAALTGTVEVADRVRVEQTAGWFNALYVAGSDWAAAASVAVRDGWFTNVATGQRLLPADARRWYSLLAVLHTDTQRFDLSIDGQQVLSGAAFRQTSADVARVSVGVGDGITGTVHVDSVTAHRVPDPSVDYVVLDQFNDTAVGSPPAGYAVTAQGGTAGVVAVPGGADRGLLLAKTGASGEDTATRTFAAQTGTVVAQANVRTDETAGTKMAMYARSAAGAPASTIQFVNGWLVYFDGHTGYQLAPVNAGEWYTLRLVLDVAAQRFEIFIDGRRYAPAGPAQQAAPRWTFRDPAATDLGALVFGVGDGQVGTVRVDNVMVFGEPLAGPPGTVLDVRRAPYGAVGDGRTDDTAAIQRAIDDVPAGGSVFLGGGVFVTGTLRLKSDMTLWIDRDAVLRGTQDDDGYPMFDAPHDGTPSIGGIVRRALLLSVGANNLHIDGGGTIDGNGAKSAWTDGEPDAEDAYLRPLLMFLTRGQNVSVRDVAVTDAANWGVVLAEDTGVLVADVEVDSRVTGQRDGIDLVDDHDSLVERDSVWSDDDSICLKSYSATGVEDATIRLDTVGGSDRANGVKLGTASSGSFADIEVSDVLVKHTNKGALTVTAVDGAPVADVTFRRITIDDSLRAFFVLLGERTEATAPPTWVSGVRFEDVVGSGLVEPSALSGQLLAGTTYRLYDLLVDDVALSVAGGVSTVPGGPAEYSGNYPESNYWTGNSKLPVYAYYYRHVDGLTVRNAVTTVRQPDARPATATSDVLEANLS